jgi:hypothetical protein
LPSEGHDPPLAKIALELESLEGQLGETPHEVPFLARVDELSFVSEPDRESRGGLEEAFLPRRHAWPSVSVP